MKAVRATMSRTSIKETRGRSVQSDMARRGSWMAALLATVAIGSASVSGVSVASETTATSTTAVEETQRAAGLRSGEPRFANDDPSDDMVVAPPAPREGCEAELKASGLRFKPAALPVHEVGRKRKFSCGADQVVIYQGGPAKITYEPSPVVTCTMALALARFENILQEEAKRLYGKPVIRIRQLGTYSCREMANYPGWVSEHSYANAIDLEAFVLKDGTEITILKNFEKVGADDEPKKKAGKLLLSTVRRTYDEGVFSSVLTPYFDALHRNHFHLDLSRYRTDGTR